MGQYRLTEAGKVSINKIYRSKYEGQKIDGNKITKVNNFHEYISEKIGIRGSSYETIRRLMNSSEGTVNEDVARKLQELFNLDWKQHFVKVNPESDLEEQLQFENPSEEDVLKGEIRIKDTLRFEKKDGDTTDNLIDLIPGENTVKKYVSIKIDRVEYNTSEGFKEGQYIRIIHPNSYYVDNPGTKDSAVILPINPRKGKVLLVSQYRHSMRHRGKNKAWMTEIPRGFSEYRQDKDSIEAALRELKEETGFGQDVKLKFLKKIVPDSGKLCDTVDLYAAFINYQNISYKQAVRLGMSDPFWVDIIDFYLAIVSEEPITLTKEVEYVFSEETYERENKAVPKRLELNKGFQELYIDCSFTIQSALLAFPKILSQLKAKGIPELKEKLPQLIDLYLNGVQ